MTATHYINDMAKYIEARNWAGQTVHEIVAAMTGVPTEKNKPVSSPAHFSYGDLNYEVRVIDIPYPPVHHTSLMVGVEITRKDTSLLGRATAPFTHNAVPPITLQMFPYNNAEGEDFEQTKRSFREALISYIAERGRVSLDKVYDGLQHRSATPA
jgi:hypothetical protein